MKIPNADFLERTKSEILSVPGFGVSRRRAPTRCIGIPRWKNFGLPVRNITTEGFGEEKPVAPNINPDGSDNPEGRAQNRRVQITVEK